MKSKLLPAALFASTALVLFACAGQDSGAPAQTPPLAPPPGTIVATGVQATGSFQGPITNSEGESQAILTLDVYDSSAQLTVSPSGANQVVPLDSNGQSFSATLDAVTISATWNGVSWNGQLTNGQTTNSFSLSPGASTVAAVSVGIPTGTFGGVLTYKSRGPRTMSLVLTSSTKLSDVLASTLSPEVSLGAVLMDRHGYKEVLKNVIWNRDTSTLSAEGTLMTSLGTSSLNCKLSEVNSGDKDVLQCAFSNSKARSQVASGALSQKRAVVAPPYPVKPAPAPAPVPGPAPAPVPTATATPPQSPIPPTPVPTAVPVPTATPIPAPTPIVVEKNERVFTGEGIFTNEKGEKQSRSLSLTVTLKSDPTGADQEAVVKFIIDGSRVGAKFTDAVYNSASSELRASQMLTLGPIAGALKLKCSGVAFAISNYDYYCHYESSVTNVTGEFHLKGTSH